jgi:hypothetical protein
MAGGNSVKDPLGNEIFLVHLYSEPYKEKLNDDSVEQFTKAIQKPALLLEVNGKHRELYYLRATDWDRRILLVAQFVNNRWESVRHIDNPSSEDLALVMKKGRQLI